MKAEQKVNEFADSCVEWVEYENDDYEIEPPFKLQEKFKSKKQELIEYIEAKEAGYNEAQKEIDVLKKLLNPMKTQHDNAYLKRVDKQRKARR